MCSIFANTHLLRRDVWGLRATHPGWLAGQRAHRGRQLRKPVQHNQKVQNNEICLSFAWAWSKFHLVARREHSVRSIALHELHVETSFAQQRKQRRQFRCRANDVRHASARRKEHLLRHDLKWDVIRRWLNDVNNAPCRWRGRRRCSSSVSVARGTVGTGRFHNEWIQTVSARKESLKIKKWVLQSKTKRVLSLDQRSPRCTS